MSDGLGLGLAEIAAARACLSERAQALLAELRRHLRFDAAWMALAEPLGSGYTSLASDSLDASTVEYLSGPQMAKDIEVTGTHRNRAPLSPSDLPYPADELPTWAECLIPAGYHEALAVPLFEAGQRHVGFLALLSAETQPPAETVREHVGRLAPTLARGIDPMRSLVTAARVVQDATAGAVLGMNGAVAPLPGLAEDRLLAAGSAVLDAARTAVEAARSTRPSCGRAVAATPRTGTFA